MSAYLVRRLLQALGVIFVTSIVLFGLLYIAPGGPLSEVLAAKTQTTTRTAPIKPEDIERLKKQYDLDLPMWQAYTRWAFGWPTLADREPRLGIIRGDLGRSWRLSENEPTGRIFMRVLPNTLLLMISATLLSLAVAIPVGVYSATKQYSKADYTVTSLTFFGIAMPAFWLGTMMILFFSFTLKDWGLPYLPPGSVTAERAYLVPWLGRIYPASPMDRLLHLILPTITLSLLYMATWSRFTRSSMLEVLRQDYVRTARAKGLSEKLVLRRHALRNALIPLITVITLQIPVLFGGAIITETIFNWRGMGRVFYDALIQADWPVALAFLIINSVLIIFANLLADVLYTIADPRIRLA
jgi:peptide/nickel transport system permease protein